MGDELLQIEAGGSETGAAQSARRRRTPRRVRVRRFAKPHADAAAARGALEHDGIADASGRRAALRPLRFQQIRCPAAAARRFRAAMRARRVLQAECAHLFRRGSDEDDARALAGFGESGVLAQESVAGMDRLGARAGARRRGSRESRDNFARAAAGRWRRLHPPARRAASGGRLRSRRRRSGRPCGAAYE